MRQIIQPLRNGWKIEEDKGFVPDQIIERVQSEDWYTFCKGYPLIKQEDISGRLGKPLLELIK